MSTTPNPLLTTIPTQIAIYLGLTTLIGGVLGGILNIVVFVSLRTFRQNSCAFFLTVMSFFNIGQLLTGLFSRILITGFNKDWTETSPAFCKLRIYCLHVCTLISYTCICLATIDQYLATSLRPRWQQMMTLRRAQYLCAFFIVAWLLYGIPSLVWYAPVFSARTGINACTTTNPVFTTFLRYIYTLVLTGILPIIITVVFGSLAYRNVRQIPYRTVPLVRRELDKQLTSMVLVQVGHNFLVNLPYVTILLIAFHIDLPPDSSALVNLRFSNFISGMAYYFCFSSPFYIYVCVSKRFRQQLAHVLIKIYYGRTGKHDMGGNQVAPQSIESIYH